MVRWQVGVFGPLAVLACVAAPVTLAVMEQRQIKNFHVVRPGVLYRSAQLTPAGLRRVVHDQRIRTVINLREGTARFDVAEEEFCRREEIRFIRLLPKGWDDSVGPAEVDDNVRVFLDVMRNPANYPVLIHCFAGIHRTGAYCAVYRMEFEGWDNASAIAEVKAMGYDNFDNELDIKGWLQGYRPGRLQAAAEAESLKRLADQIKPGMSAEEVDRLIGDEETDRTCSFCERSHTYYSRLGLKLSWTLHGKLAVRRVERYAPTPGPKPVRSCPDKTQSLTALPAASGPLDDASPTHPTEARKSEPAAPVSATTRGPAMFPLPIRRDTPHQER